MFIILTMSLLSQQRSVIRYFVLHGKSNQQIAAKPAKGHDLDALCLRVVQKWVADFAPGSTTLKTMIDPAEPLKRIFAMRFSVFLRKPTLHREMSARRCLPRKQQFSEYSLASG
jgi:hypothetical protein